MARCSALYLGVGGWGVGGRVCVLSAGGTLRWSRGVSCLSCGCASGDAPAACAAAASSSRPKPHRGPAPPPPPPPGPPPPPPPPPAEQPQQLVDARPVPPRRHPQLPAQSCERHGCACVRHVYVRARAHYGACNRGTSAAPRCAPLRPGAPPLPLRPSKLPPKRPSSPAVQAAEPVVQALQAGQKLLVRRRQAQAARHNVLGQLRRPHAAHAARRVELAGAQLLAQQLRRAGGGRVRGAVRWAARRRGETGAAHGARRAAAAGFPPPVAAARPAAARRGPTLMSGWGSWPNGAEPGARARRGEGRGLGDPPAALRAGQAERRRRRGDPRRPAGSPASCEAAPSSHFMPAARGRAQPSG
jgi:hypothetical protein